MSLQDEIDQRVADLIPQARAEAWKVYQRAPHALELDELESLALLGLSQAAAHWEGYCARRGFDPYAFQFFSAYSLRRMRGAMLDAMRSQDWVTRSDRTRAKAIRDAGQDQGATDEQLARATGLTVREVQQTTARVAARPVSIDAESHDMADSADIESSAVVASVLAAATAVIRKLPPDSQVLLGLRHYHGYSVAACAAAIGVPEEEAARALTGAALQIHDAMLRAVTL